MRTECCNRLQDISILHAYSHLILLSDFSLVREADSGVVTDAGPSLSTTNSPALDSRLSVLSTVSPSVSLDNLDLGEEAATSSDQSARTIEALTITEYEGSPRRYGPTGPRKPGRKSHTSQQRTHHTKHARGEFNTFE